jgi:hypothetical protein
VGTLLPGGELVAIDGVMARRREPALNPRTRPLSNGACTEGEGGDECLNHVNRWIGQAPRFIAMARGLEALGPRERVHGFEPAKVAFAQR